MALKNEFYSIHFNGRVRGKCDGRLQNWPGIINERPKFLAMSCMELTIIQVNKNILYEKVGGI